jgi:hypothetical protein
MRLDAGQFEVVDDQMADILRQKTGAERLAIVDGLFRLAQELVTGAVRAAHPTWDRLQISREVARRVSHGAV